MPLSITYDVALWWWWWYAVQESHLEYLERCAGVGVNGRGPGGITFRPSTSKAVDALQFLPTNLHVQEMRVRELPGMPSVMRGHSGTPSHSGVVAVEHMIRQWSPLEPDNVDDLAPLPSRDSSQRTLLVAASPEQPPRSVVHGVRTPARGTSSPASSAADATSADSSAAATPRSVATWSVPRFFVASDAMAVKANDSHNASTMGFTPEMMNHLQASEVPCSMPACVPPFLPVSTSVPACLPASGPAKRLFAFTCGAG
jgi:hypothetical protein